jgi:hypothetical protein
MTPDELRAIMEYLRDRVRLISREGESPAGIAFEAPTEEDMTAAGLNAEGARRILGVPWWKEMVEDIVETPEMCDPGDPPQQVLEYARDVVSEYIRKRFALEET